MILPPSSINPGTLKKLISPRYRKERSITSAYASWTYNPWPAGGRKKGRKAEGLRFERKVVDVLASIYPTFIHSLPFRYFSLNQASSYCIPDGLLVLNHEVIIVEIKLSHTVEAYFQLRNLYFPVVEKAWKKKVRGVEIVKNFDREVRFPEESEVFTSLNSFLLSAREVGVCLWGR